MEKRPVGVSRIDTVSWDLKSPLLDGLDRPAREAVLAGSIQCRFAAKSVVTNQDRPADHLLVLTEGCARHFYITEEGKKFLLEWLGPGDLFGARTILSTRSSYLASTETVKNSSVLMWDRTTIRGLIARYPRLLENALLTASDYVTWHLTSHIGIASYTARSRAEGECHEAVGGANMEADMPCKSCFSVNRKKFGAEMGIHFLGLKNIDKPIVWVFPELVVCLDCGAAEFVVPEAELRELVKDDAAAAAG